MSIDPKSIEVGLTLIPADAVPVIVTVTPPPELVTAMVADFDPAAAGWNETSTVVKAAGASVVAPGVPAWKSAALLPATTNGGVSVIAVVEMFLMVSAALAVPPAASDPKPSEPGVTTIPGVTAPARFCGSLGVLSVKSVALLP